MKTTEQALRKLVEYLWDIIDNIDTAGDIAKSHDSLFRNLVENYQNKRWDTGITTDGYTIDIEPAIRKLSDTNSDEAVEELLRKAEEQRLYEKACMDLAWSFPPEVVMWCFYRILAHATTGEYGNTSPTDLTWQEAVKRWNKDLTKPEQKKREVKVPISLNRVPDGFNWEDLQKDLLDFQRWSKEPEVWKKELDNDTISEIAYSLGDLVDHGHQQYLDEAYKGNPVYPLYNQSPLYWWLGQNFGWKVVHDLWRIQEEIRPASESLDDTIQKGQPLYNQEYLEECRLRVDDLIRRIYNYRDDLNEYLKQAEKENVTFFGKRVYNPHHLSEEMLEKMLTYIAALVRLLKIRGLEKCFLKDIKGFTLRFATEQDGKSNAYYDQTKQWVILLHRVLDHDIEPRISNDWPLEVVVHEFGHHIHLHSLSPQARAFWNDPWEDLQRAQDLEQANIITEKDRDYYYRLLLREALNDLNTPQKSVDKFLKKIRSKGPIVYRKATMWLYDPSPNAKKPLIKSPQKPRLTPYGEEVLQELKEYGGDVRTNDSIVKILVPYNLGDNYPKLVPEGELKNLLQGYPTHEELIRKLDLPTNYAATNSKEDFAETFMTYILDPDKLSPTARYRFLKTMKLSGFYGKEIMKLSYADWEFDLENALNALWGPIRDWVYHPSVGKKEILKAYQGLRNEEKKALEMDVERSIKKHHGGRTFTAYRRIKDGSEVLKGLDSVTTNYKFVEYIDPEYWREYKIKASDVLAHWGQDLPLASKNYSHEKEVILKPGVRIKPVRSPKTSRKDLSDLGLATATENGISFKTGKSVSFPYMRNTEKSPNMGSRFSQDIEPAGRYILHDSSNASQHPLKNWEYGDVSFKNPLVLKVSLDENIYGTQGWKQRLVTHYQKKGKALSRALLREGFDGIVTVRGNDTLEIVDLTVL